MRFQGSIAAHRNAAFDAGTGRKTPRSRGNLVLFSGDVVSGNAQKMTPGRQIPTVQIVVDGKAEKQASTKANYGLA